MRKSPSQSQPRLSSRKVISRPAGGNGYRCGDGGGSRRTQSELRRQRQQPRPGEIRQGADQRQHDEGHDEGPQANLHLTLRKWE